MRARRLNDVTSEEWDRVAAAIAKPPAKWDACIKDAQDAADRSRTLGGTGSIAIKHDSEKLRMDLVLPEMEEALAEGLTAGLDKGYEENNWMKGLKFSRSIAAAKRHLNAWRKGEDIDKETGVNHLKLAALNLLMVAYQVDKGRSDLDDRI